MKQELPIYEELLVLGWEMSVSMPSNQSEAWARIFAHLALVVSPGWAVRLFWLVNTIVQLSPIPIDVERLRLPVTRQEAFNIGYAGSALGIENLATLARISYQLEGEVGPDHHAFAPVRWYQQGVLQRGQTLAQSIGQEGAWSS